MAVEGRGEEASRKVIEKVVVAKSRLHPRRQERNIRLHTANGHKQCIDSPEFIISKRSLLMKLHFLTSP